MEVNNIGFFAGEFAQDYGQVKDGLELVFQPVYGQSLTQPGMQNMGQGVMQGQGMPMQGMPVQGNVPGYGTPIQPQATPTPTPTPTPGTQRPVFGSAGTSAPQSRVQSSQLNIPDFLRRK